MNARILTALAAVCWLATPALAADNTVKIGLVTTLSGPAGVIGKHMKDAADLAMDMLGHKIGGKPAEIVYGDDQFKPDVGRQVAEQMVKRDKVDFMTGFIWSNVLLASYEPVIKSGIILIGANAGPHELAGAMCAPNYFSASWQNDQTPEAMGKYMNDQKMDDVYLIAPDYAAGKDMVNGFKRYFKGKIAAEVFTKPGQADYQVEISQLRSVNPKALFIFLPGGMGIQFIKQYDQAGLRGSGPVPASRHGARGGLRARSGRACGRGSRAGQAGQGKGNESRRGGPVQRNSHDDHRSAAATPGHRSGPDTLGWGGPYPAGPAPLALLRLPCSADPAPPRR